MLSLTKDALTNYALQQIELDVNIRVEFTDTESVFKSRASQHTHK